MMLVEHLLLVFVVVTLLYIVFLIASLSAQLLDVDHTCDDCKTLSERVSRLLKCGKATDLGTFPEDCYHLHRGIFHHTRLFYIEVLGLFCVAGLVFGHGLHLLADGYDIFRLQWLVGIIKGFLRL